MVILVDTSAWIEYLRGTGSAANVRVRALLLSDQAVATTEAVVMELLAGGRNDVERRRIQEVVDGCELLPVGGLDDFEHAADLYRSCRERGETVRALVDCLIGAVAIRNNVPVLHDDADFDVLARHTAVRVSA
ncbi:MAG: PIN domain nuclease [Actinobacteria bacterium]|nr:MAG: PIN domain nuclease [Actinomycetota bacterium]